MIEQAVQLVDRGDGQAVDADDGVVHPQPGALRRRIGLHFQHPERADLVDFEKPRHAPVQRYGGARQANEGAPHLAVGEELSDDPFRRVDGGGEADGLRAWNDGGVHAYDAGAAVEQRPARIARVQRRVGLNDVVDQPPGGRPQRTAQRRYHARGDAVRIAQRVADGNRDLAHAQACRIAQLRMRQCTARADSQQRKVGVRVFAHQFGAARASVGARDVDGAGTMHHMAVGEHIPVRGEQEARARAPTAARVLHGDEDDGVLHLLDAVRDGLGIGVEQAGIGFAARRT